MTHTRTTRKQQRNPPRGDSVRPLLFDLTARVLYCAGFSKGFRDGTLMAVAYAAAKDKLGDGYPTRFVVCSQYQISI